MNKNIKLMLIILLIIVILWLITYFSFFNDKDLPTWVHPLNERENISNQLNNINEEKEFDFSKYYTDQCPEWEFMTSWIKYPDWKIKVDKCSKSFSCSEWKKIISQCSSMIWDVPCKIYCIWENEPVPEW